MIRSAPAPQQSIEPIITVRCVCSKSAAKLPVQVVASSGEMGNGTPSAFLDRHLGALSAAIHCQLSVRMFNLFG
jgi:hypothetical protein